MSHASHHRGPAIASPSGPSAGFDRLVARLLRLSFTVLSLVVAGPALADKRIALVIGNSAYSRAPKLANPGHDAIAMEAMLKAAGFDRVERASDVGAAAMRRALRNFADLANDADVAVVFYAGHGIEVAGVNYLIPVDAVLERDIDVQDEAISLDRLNQILEPVRRLRLIILDACRDNPFARSMRRTIATRSVRSGYGDIDERSLPPNTLIAYAQRAGATAEDGSDRNSPYTQALLRHLPTPGVDIELALRRVRDDVLKATRNRQEPFKYGSLGGTELPLVARSAGETAVTSVAPAPESAVEAASSREWRSVDKTSVAELETFLSRHASSPEADYARARLADLKDARAREAQRASESEVQARETEAKRLAAIEARERETAREAARRQAAELERSLPPRPDPVARTQPTATTAFRIKPGVSQGIHNMRTGPGTGHSLVVSIPAGSDGVLVELESCRASDDGRTTFNWCRARWQGRSGWLSMGGLQR